MNIFLAQSDHTELRAPLVGREKERAFLYQKLDLCARGQGTTVVIAGGGGLGKTRLLEEVEEEATRRGMLVMRSTAGTRVTALAYGLFTRVLEIYLASATDGERRALQKTIAELAPHLWELLFPDEPKPAATDTAEVNPALVQSLFLARLGRLLLQLAEKKPLLLCLEDLQRADSASLEGLRQLTGRNANKPFIILGTYRLAYQGRGGADLESTLKRMQHHPHFHQLNLEPLAATDIRALLSLYYGRGFPEGLIEQIQRRCGGVPFFVMQYLETLRDKGVLSEKSGTWSMEEQTEATVEVPDSIRAALFQRLEGLEDDVRQLLSQASIQGDTFEEQLLIRACSWPADQTITLLDKVVRQTRLVKREGAQYRFTHSLITEIFYEFLPDQRRRQGHLRLAVTLADQPTPNIESLAYHFYHGGAFKRALPHLLEAAQREQMAFAYGEAERFLQQAEVALDKADGVPKRQNRLRILLCHIEIEARTGTPDQVIDLCQTVLDLADPHEDKEVRARSLMHIGAAMARQAQWDRAVQSYQDAQDLFAELADSTRIAMINVQLGNIAYECGDLGEATNYLRKAKDEAVQKRNFTLLGTIFGNLGIFASIRGRYREAVTHYNEALKAYRKVKHQYGLCQTYQNLGLTHTLQEEWQIALTFFGEAEKLAQEMGTVDVLANILVSQAPAQLGLGDLENARVSCVQSRVYMRQLGDQLGLAECDKVEGMIMLKWCAFTEADKLLRLARRRFHKVDNKLGVAECELELGRTKQQAGSPTKASRHLERAALLFGQIGAEAEVHKAKELLDKLGI